MSSITVTPPTVCPVPATRLCLTPRGRRVLLGLACLPLAAGIVFAVLGGGSAYAGSANVSPAFGTVTVMPGDTLWSIAGEVAPDADPRDVIGQLNELNGLSGAALMVGQELAVPSGYSD